MSKLNRLKRRDWNKYALTKTLVMPIIKQLEELESSFNIEDIASIEQEYQKGVEQQYQLRVRSSISKALPKYK